MRFLEVKSGEFIAIDTIARIHDVVTVDVVYTDGAHRHAQPEKSFSVTTKRGEVYTGVRLEPREFFKLVLGE
jgi:hypothetical protein